MRRTPPSRARAPFRDPKCHPRREPRPSPRKSPRGAPWGRIPSTPTVSPWVYRARYAGRRTARTRRPGCNSTSSTTSRRRRRRARREASPTPWRVPPRERVASPVPTLSFASPRNARRRRNRADPRRRARRRARAAAAGSGIGARNTPSEVDGGRRRRTTTTLTTEVSRRAVR